jgi:hypothetical protein
MGTLRFAHPVKFFVEKSPCRMGKAQRAHHPLYRINHKKQEHIHGI